MSAFVGKARSRALMSVSACIDSEETSEPLGLLGEGAKSEGIPSSELGAWLRDATIMEVEGELTGCLPPRVSVGDAAVRAGYWRNRLIVAVGLALAAPLVFLILRYVIASYSESCSAIPTVLVGQEPGALASSLRHVQPRPWVLMFLCVHISPLCHQVIDLCCNIKDSFFLFSTVV